MIAKVVIDGEPCMIAGCDEELKQRLEAGPLTWDGQQYGVRRVRGLIAATIGAATASVSATHSPVFAAQQAYEAFRHELFMSIARAVSVPLGLMQPAGDADPLPTPDVVVPRSSPPRA